MGFGKGRWAILHCVAQGPLHHPMNQKNLLMEETLTKGSVFFFFFFGFIKIYDLLLLSVQLLDPHPIVVANKLLARSKFIDSGKQFNMIACSWIQFMIHDWIDHLEDTQQVLTHIFTTW